MSNPEQAIRNTAAAFHAAIVEGQKVGLEVPWPRSINDLANIQINETGRLPVKTVITAPAGISEETLAAANEAATAAAVEVIANAPDRPLDDAELEAMNKAELQQVAADRHVDVSGASTKPEIIAAIKAAQDG